LRGSSCGFKLAGFEVKAAIDKNPLATDSYKLNFPNASVLTEEVTDAGAEIIARKLLEAGKLDCGECTVLLGCPPCQGFCRLSRDGAKDPRNGLILTLAKIAAVIKPEFCVIENVPGLSNGVGREIFQKAIEELKLAGYSNVAWQIVDAADFGVPQRRRRLLLIASRLCDVGIPNPSGHARKSVRQTIAWLPPIIAGASDPNDYLHCSPKASEKVLERIRSIPKDGGSRKSLPAELQLECHKRHSGFCDVYGRMKWDEPAPTITTGCINVTKGRFIHPEQDRAISVREAALLQTFPRDYRFCGTPWQVARQIGEAVPVEFARIVANHIVNLKNRYIASERHG